MIAGGISYIILRLLTMSEWPRSVLQLSYVTANQPVALSLTLLLIGVFALSARYAATLGRLGIIGWGLVGIGLVMRIVGVVVEFWWAGGMRGHPAGAMLGWGLYLLGILVLALGLTLVGLAMLRSAALPRWSRPIPFITAVAALAWPFTVFLKGGPGLSPEIQWTAALAQAGVTLLFGLGWTALGYMLASPSSVRHTVQSGSARGS